MNTLFLVSIWTLFLWSFGWALLPASRQVFRNLPDGGLAAGRVGGLALLTLGGFWLASLHLLPLHFTPLWLIGLPLLCFAGTWKDAAKRQQLVQWVKEHSKELAFSDGVFLAIWFLFLWIRARNGALSDLEKPMDAALLGTLSRALYLPFDSFWQSGTPFTNYYYFGPLMGAGLARTLGTPNFIAYNLVQPAFCAFFVSVLWSLCAALTGSRWRGVCAAGIVALLGNFEPVRQIIEGRNLWPLDWWKTARVIPNTINEYPLFTMASGDAHAHFYEFAVAAVFFTLCYALFSSSDETEENSQSISHRDVVLLGIGALLSVIWLTNTWDVPLYALLALICALWSSPKHNLPDIVRCLLPFVLARLLAWPFTHLSHPNVSGAVKEFWLPDAVSFLLIWAGPLLLVVLASSHWKDDTKRNLFSIALATAGLLALAAPHCFYMRGVFGDGEYRHQDTVFKFGLQAWLLLGTAGACGAVALWSRWPKFGKTAALAYLAVPALCSATVVWQRTTVMAPLDNSGHIKLSLNGAQHLPPADQAAIAWLAQNAKPGDVVVEAAGRGSYNEFGRIAALTGVPTPLGWDQHVAGWGGEWPEIDRRRAAVEQVYAWNSDEEGLAALAALKARYVFVGELERRSYGPEALARMRAKLKSIFQDGETIILATETV